MCKRGFYIEKRFVSNSNTGAPFEELPVQGFQGTHQSLEKPNGAQKIQENHP